MLYAGCTRVFAGFICTFCNLRRLSKGTSVAKVAALCLCHGAPVFCNLCTHLQFALPVAAL